MISTIDFEQMPYNWFSIIYAAVQYSTRPSVLLLESLVEVKEMSLSSGGAGPNSDSPSSSGPSSSGPSSSTRLNSSGLSGVGLSRSAGLRSSVEDTTI